MKKDLLTWLRGIAGKSPRVLWAAAFALGLFFGASAMASDYGAGLFAGHISGIDSLDKTIARPKPDRIVASIEHAANEDPAFWGDQTMWVYWGQIYLDGLEYWFGENIGDAVYLVIDGETVLDDNSPSTTTHGTIQRPAGWYDFELRMYNGFGLAEPHHDNSGASSKRGFCYAKGVPEAYRPTLVWNDLVPVDPGDGTFFRRDKDLVRTISVNFTGGQGGNTPVSTGRFAGERIGHWVYAVEGASWVDCTEVGGSGGVPTTRVPLSLRDDSGVTDFYTRIETYLCSRPGTWNDRSTSVQNGNAQMLRCYLDDNHRGSQPTPFHDHAGFKLKNLPFSRYTVIVYFNRDGEGPIPAYNVNGRWYKGTSEGTVLAEPSESWGNSCPGAGRLSEAENTLVVRGLTSSTLVVQSPGASSSARGCIAGFQVIGELEPDSHRYMVVDLAGGREASGYPVTWLDEVPPGGWNDEYKTTKLAFRRIDPGVFQMGSPEDEAGRQVDEVRHEVTLTKPCYIGIFETTQKQWERVQGNNPARHTGDMRPVDQVSYEDIRGASAGAGWPASTAVDADSFLGRLRSKTGLACLDLPTEAEWEYACRAGTTGPLNVDGKALDELGRYEGNWSDNRGGYAEYHTAVGWYAPNAWGLWDMHGNVGEWCIDRTASFGSVPETDPVGSWSGKLHTVRGGGWSSTMKNCRSAYRLSQYPNSRSDTIGFRTAVRPRRLTVTSEHGNPYPGTGERLVFDETVTASVESPLRAENGTYRVCTGWTGTGSVPASGTKTSVTFTMAEDSSITWNWTPPSRHLKVSVADGGSADFSEGWIEDGKTITVNVSKPAPGDEIVLVGDAEGVRIEGDALKIPIDRERHVTVVFDTPHPLRYMVVDLSGGTAAASYPVSYLPDVPEGGWTNELHRTERLVMRRIPAGVFTMGSPTNETGRLSNETQHEVTLTRSFYIGVFPVSQRQWELVMGNNPSELPGADHPVERVSYDDIRGQAGSEGSMSWPAGDAVDADSFMGRVRAKTGLAGFDLPTEAEWEYACRAGTKTALNTGKDLSDAVNSPEMAAAGRYRANQADGQEAHPGHATVGMYKPNAWGLYDMHGNVWEWCLDRTGSADDWVVSGIESLGTAAVTDPKGTEDGCFYVYRGGGWNNDAGLCRSATRPDEFMYSGSTDRHHGFRAAVHWEGRAFTVVSDHGSPAPSVGLHGYSNSAVVTASVATPVMEGKMKLHHCEGWTGTGSAPASGTGPNVTFQITEDSSIKWIWRTEHRLNVHSVGGGSVNFAASGWYPPSARVEVVATPGPGYVFDRWEGDVDGCALEGPSGEVPMDRPRVVTARFRDMTKGTPVAVPFEWLQKHGLAEGTADCEAAAARTAANGRPVWECYAAGLDPTDAASRFLVRIDLAKTPFVDCTPRLPGRTYTVEAKATLAVPPGQENKWFRVSPETLLWDMWKDDESVVFFRMKAELPPAREETAGLAYTFEPADGYADDGYLVSGPGDFAGGEGQELVIPRICDDGEGLHPVEGIEYGAFEGSRAFSHVIVPEGVRFIGDYAFTGSSLATISLPEGIETIGYRAFHSTPWFYDQPDDALMLLWLGEARERSFVYGWKGNFAAGTTLELPPGVSGIADRAFSRQTGLAAVSFPTGLVTIGISAFSGCSGLTSLVLPEGLKTLWFYAFERCTGLTSVSLPEGVTLQDNAFDECSSLASVSLPDSTRSIGSHVFRGTRLLADQPDGLLRVGNFVCGWKGTMAEGTDVVIPAGTKGIADVTFSQCGAMASVVLPEGLEWIGISAFGECMGLTSLSLPTTLRRIDPMAFVSCSHLTGNVTIPSGVKEIANGAFFDCGKLTSVTIADGVETIAMGAFLNCSSLTNAVIPESVTKIGLQAFAGTGLKTVVLPGGLTKIEEGAFDNCALVSVTIPAGVVSIDRGAFYNCTALTKIVFRGTKAQWAAIPKGENWNLDVPATVVHCSDGDVAL